MRLFRCCLAPHFFGSVSFSSWCFPSFPSCLSFIFLHLLVVLCLSPRCQFFPGVLFFLLTLFSPPSRPGAACPSLLSPSPSLLLHPSFPSVYLSGEYTAGGRDGASCFSHSARPLTPRRRPLDCGWFDGSSCRVVCPRCVCVCLLTPPVATLLGDWPQEHGCLLSDERGERSSCGVNSLQGWFDLRRPGNAEQHVAQHGDLL